MTVSSTIFDIWMTILHDHSFEHMQGQSRVFQTSSKLRLCLGIPGIGY